MATIHRAQIRPTKIELLAGWLPDQPWYAAETDTELRAVGAYRFDDPAGEVGIESHLVRAGDGPVLHVPLTYRGAPLPGADAHLIDTMEHSVLGRRWVYDACGDPVYVTALAETILGRRTQAVEYLEVEGQGEPREPTAVVAGTGGDGDAPSDLSADALTATTAETVTVCRTPTVELRVQRVIDPAATPDGARLTGTWAGQSDPALLATARFS
ncbi:CG0192-related protein [Solicola gregarius]|uniref:Maltokinase N-terminal cap domain-containing protein n=1 Tax=Solicola gregarius TaxID=2908642 RepID=A0AA46TL40_9ACTN|nr:hypothetical protein [Solicola gregarius]UYM07297.1 hypothetical protein L0C25_09540 [Solicola gregarius]